MSRETSWEARRDLPGDRLGVMDVVGMGWRLLKSDFWPLWLVGLVYFALLMASNVVPFSYIIIGPPLMAGLFYTIRRRIDGGRCEVGQIFEGFKQRFGQSVVAMLPYFLVFFVGILIDMVILFGVFGVFGVMAESGGHRSGDEVAKMVCSAAFVLPLIVHVLLILAISLLYVFFIFAPLAVWDHRESGWEAAKASMRLVRGHFWPTIGFWLLFGLIGGGAALAGYITCCVGFIFTVPAWMVWQHASLIYLYRGWTGQPLVQPIAGGGPTVGPAGPSDLPPPPGA